MNKTVIRAENLSKQYKIGVAKSRHGTLRDRITAMASSLFRRHGVSEDQPSTIWALKDVSFEVERGEAVGIIGRNGAGKSTILKLLSRITKPTEGSADIFGRVGSLLEVGTGFHPELSGRENIYFNGAILGMKKAEIDRKFDAIVDFSGVEKFIDTPVKWYSSGMYVRLAFAVAAHLEPDILIVDEVLAVGDAAFQKKCLGKMDEATKDGRTVLFVSHNLAAVSTLCSRALQFDGGRLVGDDSSRAVVSKYLRESRTISGTPVGDRTDRHGNQRLRFLGLHFRDEDDNLVDDAVTGQPLKIALHYKTQSESSLRNVYMAVQINGQYGERLFNLATQTMRQDFDDLPNEGVVVCEIPRLPLQPGTYTINVYSAINDVILDWVIEAGNINVVRGDFFGTGRLPSDQQGPFLVDHSWRLDHSVPNPVQTISVVDSSHRYPVEHSELLSS